MGTGLVGPESDARGRDVRMMLSGGDEAVSIGERDGKRVLGLVFEVSAWVVRLFLPYDRLTKTRLPT